MDRAASDVRALIFTTEHIGTLTLPPRDVIEVEHDLEFLAGREDILQDMLQVLMSRLWGTFGGEQECSGGMSRVLETTPNS
ncbi:OLC1v1016021C1 [Oldenlandia corymbosa var. corymbosa]|uniref:OLC1v1016021C1 n=1 Tax=Oldenlandia corymbosa var. corymbosa TaxID=529605 RepID=A0AAV1E776_OLDCO|nr:OLC1v1016021C1 [Oldenlandia corymbosa var. corymbosa]